MLGCYQIWLMVALSCVSLLTCGAFSTSVIPDYQAWLRCNYLHVTIFKILGPTSSHSPGTPSPSHSPTYLPMAPRPISLSHRPGWSSLWHLTIIVYTMSILTAITVHTSTIMIKDLSCICSTMHQPSATMSHLAVRSATTLYPPAPSDSTSTLAQTPALSTSIDPKQPQSTSNTLSPTIPATAFWAVLAALILVLVLLAAAFPIWYWLRGRHKSKNPGPPSPPNPLLGSAQPIQWSQPQHLSPAQIQQLQILNQLQNPASVAPSRDPNRRALLARLAALNNPSILGAIAEDSTVLTSSSGYPGDDKRPVVNQHWADLREKRLREARGRGEVCQMEVAGDVVEREKKVRFREREWALLASDGGGSRIEEIVDDVDDGHGNLRGVEK